MTHRLMIIHHHIKFDKIWLSGSGDIVKTQSDMWAGRPTVNRCTWELATYWMIIIYSSDEKKRRRKKQHDSCTQQSWLQTEGSLSTAVTVKRRSALLTGSSRTFSYGSFTKLGANWLRETDTVTGSTCVTSSWGEPPSLAVNSSW